MRVKCFIFDSVRTAIRHYYDSLNPLSGSQFYFYFHHPYNIFVLFLAPNIFQFISAFTFLPLSTTLFVIFLHHAMFYIDWLNLAFHKSWITFCIFQCWFLQSWRKTFFSYFPVWSVLISRQRLVSLFCMACPWKQARIWTFPSNV